MFAAFIVIFGLSGQPVFAGHSSAQYDTIEACDADNKAQAAIVAKNLDAEDIQFGEIRIKCDDAGKHAFEVFGIGSPA